MYTNMLLVKSIEMKILDSGTQLWEAWCQDIRTTKDGKDFAAFTLTATFWGSTKPCEAGDYEMISGDLTQDSWKDKSTNEYKYKNVIKNAMILNVVDGKDSTPKSKAQKAFEADTEDDQEIPF